MPHKPRSRATAEGAGLLIFPSRGRNDDVSIAKDGVKQASCEREAGVGKE